MNLKLVRSHREIMVPRDLKAGWKLLNPYCTVYNVPEVLGDYLRCYISFI